MSLTFREYLILSEALAEDEPLTEGEFLAKFKDKIVDLADTMLRKKLKREPTDAEKKSELERLKRLRDEDLEKLANSQAARKAAKEFGERQLKRDMDKRSKSIGPEGERASRGGRAEWEHQDALIAKRIQGLKGAGLRHKGLAAAR